MLGFTRIAEVVTVLLGHEFIKNGLEKLGRITVERIETLTKMEPRQIFFETIRLLEEGNSTKAQVLWERVEEARHYGNENIVVNALGSVVPRDEKGNPDFNRGVKIYTWLADMPPPKFEQAMDRLKHNPVAQFLRYWIVKRGGAALGELAGITAEEMRLRRHEFEGLAARDLPHLRNEINRLAVRVRQQSDRRESRRQRRSLFYRFLANDRINVPRLWRRR